MEYLLKIVLTAVLVLAAAEAARRSPIAGAILASVPLVSVLALFWLWFDTRDTGKVAVLAGSIFWFVLPSLLFFLLLPLLLRQGVQFFLSMGLSLAATVGGYLLMLWLLRRWGG